MIDVDCPVCVPAAHPPECRADWSQHYHCPTHRAWTIEERLDHLVERWHRTTPSMSLATFLGMTDAEYAAWVLDPDAIPGPRLDLTLDC